jgi:hypothetical protein
MTNRSFAAMRMLLILGAFIALGMIGSTGASRAHSNQKTDQADVSVPSRSALAQVRSEGSILINVDIVSGGHEFLGLGAKLPESIENWSPQTFSKTAFALIVTDTDETFIRPIAFKYDGASTLTLIVPYSREWNAQQITVSGILSLSNSMHVLSPVTLSMQELLRASAKLQELLTSPDVHNKSGKISPSVVTSECFDVAGGLPCQPCQVCTTCHTRFGIETCDEFVKVCQPLCAGCSCT